MYKECKEIRIEETIIGINNNYGIWGGRKPAQV